MNEARLGTFRNPSDCSVLSHSLNKRIYAGANTPALRDIAFGNVVYPQTEGRLLLC